MQPASPGPLTLPGLRCGSAYRVYGSAGGPPGTEIAVRTTGGPLLRLQTRGGSESMPLMLDLILAFGVMVVVGQ